MHKTLYILLFLFFIHPVSKAQDKKYIYVDSALLFPESNPGQNNNPITTIIGPAQNTDTVLYESNIKMPPDSVENWKNRKAFEYAKWLDSLLKARQDKVKPSMNFSPPRGPSMLDAFLSSNFTKIFFWILAGLFILFILYKLFLTEGAFRRVGKTDKAATPLVEEELITHESDFDAMIRQAVGAGNYRLAVRYQYLKTLHQLAAKGAVALASDKTNYQYVREIKDGESRKGFAGLTLSYEYVWYGEFAITEQTYRKIENEFTLFNA